jgi:hypothetical protein
MFRVNKKGQGILELALTFVIVTALVGGIFKIWLWANNQIVERQVAYNKSRVDAGNAVDGYTLRWPVYTPPQLKEDDVLLRP